MSEVNKRNSALDSLRGLAIIMVISVHSAQIFKPLWLNHVASFSKNFGAYGVQLFFILSAFTMMMTFDGCRDFKKNSVKFWIRRFFRIAPLFYIGIVVYLILNGLSSRYFAPDGIGLYQIILTVFFLHWISPSAFNAVVPGGWSIAVEMQFYAIFPLIWIFIKKWELKKWVPYATFFVLCLIFKLIGQYIVEPVISKNMVDENKYLAAIFIDFWLPKQMICFILGVFIYKTLDDNSVDLVSLALLSLGTFFIYRHWGSVVGVLALFSYFVLKSSVSIKIFSYIGTISYSMYLIHFSMIDFFYYLTSRSGYSFPFEFAVFFVFLSSALISLVTRRYIELPSVAFGKFIIRKLFVGGVTSAK